MIDKGRDLEIWFNSRDKTAIDLGLVNLNGPREIACFLPSLNLGTLLRLEDVSTQLERENQWMKITKQASHLTKIETMKEFVKAELYLRDKGDSCEPNYQDQFEVAMSQLFIGVFNVYDKPEARWARAKEEISGLTKEGLDEDQAERLRTAMEIVKRINPGF
jgi:hypothetical protein